MKTSILTFLLIAGLSTSTLAFSQSLSLYDYYNEYMVKENISDSSTPLKHNGQIKVSLAEYYSEYCADNNTLPLNKQVKNNK